MSERGGAYLELHHISLLIYQLSAFSDENWERHMGEAKLLLGERGFLSSYVTKTMPLIAGPEGLKF